MAPIFQDNGSSNSSSSIVTSTTSPLQFFSMMSLPPSLTWLQELKSEERGLCLIHLLLTCANHVSNGTLDDANTALEHISHLASPNGDTMQRIASYFTEALADRVIKSWPGLYTALNFSKNLEDDVDESILAHKLFSELFPFLKVAYVVTNQTIIEAMEDEKIIHVIDLNASEPLQWIALIQALSMSGRAGMPHLRITGVNQRKEVLDQMARALIQEAEKFDLPFQFNPVVVSRLEDLDMDKLRVKTGEALAISSVLQLHSVLANEDDDGDVTIDKRRNLSHNDNSNSNSSSPCSSMNGFLNKLRGLSPKVLVVTEQDSNHNGSGLMERVLESLYYYAALFDCAESTLPRSCVERLKVEKMMFGKEIKNIVACEGVERKERHEKLDKWVQRLELAGFGMGLMSCVSGMQARRLVQSYGGGSGGYRIKEENGCVVICWHDRPLYTVSAWRCRR